MGAAARNFALDTPWDKAFEMTYLAYRLCQKSQQNTFIGGADNHPAKNRAVQDQGRTSAIYNR